MHNSYWKYYFCDHLNSAQHKENGLKEVNHEADNRRHILKREPSKIKQNNQFSLLTQEIQSTHKYAK